MKQTIFIAFIALLIITPLQMSAAWTQQDNGTIQGYRGITLNGEHLIAVGNTGNITFSADGGEAWEAATDFANNWWFDVTTNSDGNAVAVGESGAYVISTDNGQTWTQYVLSSTVDFNSIDLSADYGYIVGADGTMLYYSNNVNNWFVGSSSIIEDLFVVQDQEDGTAWAAGEQGRLVYIANGGLSMTDMGRVANDHIRGLYFEPDGLRWSVEEGAMTIASNNRGWIVGDNGMFKFTEDNGTSWENISIDGLSSQDLYDMQVHDGHIVVAGDKIVIVSEDGGETWESHDFIEENLTFHAAYINEDAFWVAGTEYDVWSSVYLYEFYTEAEPEETEEIIEEEEEEAEEVPGLGELSVEMGNLIKSTCDGDSTGLPDPCRAVYYYADDGYRHAFPNEKVFFTWFDDFDDVVEISSDDLSDIPLGSNVTYHPGTKMVKFVTVPTVYAVSLGGVLRAIGSEEAASELYGEDWNQQIDDISDVFLGNYTFGDDIESADDYDVDAEISSASSLDDNF